MEPISDVVATTLTCLVAGFPQPETKRNNKESTMIVPEYRFITVINVPISEISLEVG
jgi:hypothetical protein